MRKASKTVTLSFAAEPRLQKAVLERATEYDMTTSEFLRDLVRASLGLRPDYATQPGMDSKPDNSRANLP